MRTILIIVISVLLIRCSGKYEETDSHAQTGQKKRLLSTGNQYIMTH